MLLAVMLLQLQPVYHNPHATQCDLASIILSSHSGAAFSQELLQELVFAEECGRLISPPCWKTGRYCSGRLRTPPKEGAIPPETPLLQRARAAGLKVYPHTFRNEARPRPTLCRAHCIALCTRRPPTAAPRQRDMLVLACSVAPPANCCARHNLHEVLH